MEAEQVANQEKIRVMQEARVELENSFKALAGSALKDSNDQFLKLASATFERFQQQAKGDLDLRHQSIDDMVKPIKASLDKVDEKIQAIETTRAGAYSSLQEQIKGLMSLQGQLQAETHNLVKALRTPNVRGRWGELQLRRVVELAGMVEHCDFVEQASTDTETGRLRPDMVVKLPGGRQIVVDSKVPLHAFLDAQSTDDDSKKTDLMRAHARQVKTHLAQLGSKAYWDQFDATPEIVVMFLSGENVFSAALQYDPELIEYGVSQKVIIATPTTLIALLKAVSYGWRQELLTKHAREISELGTTLHQRIAKVAEHVRTMGSGLGRSVDAYNAMVSSLESRVLVTARKFKELGAESSEEIPPSEPIEKLVRPVQAEELLPTAIPAATRESNPST